MGNYNGKRGRSGGGYQDREQRQLFKAVCDNCGKNCEVPFKPTGNKPVLCRDCFSKDKPQGDRRDDRGRNRSEHRGDRRAFGGDRDARRPMNEGRSQHYDLEFEKLNEKLDKILQKLTPVHTRDGVKSVEVDEANDEE